MPNNVRRAQGDCTTKTCMKWGEDGSLSSHDQNNLMRQLCSSDPALVGSEACQLYKNDN